MTEELEWNEQNQLDIMKSVSTYKLKSAVEHQISNCVEN